MGLGARAGAVGAGKAGTREKKLGGGCVQNEWPLLDPQTARCKRVSPYKRKLSSAVK